MRRYASLALIAVVVTTTACAGILGLRPAGRQPFPHRTHVLKGLGCKTCHVGLATAGDDDPLHIPAPSTCTTADCHAKPHDTNSCDGCHGLPAARAGAQAAREELRFEHKTHVTRVKGNCMRCHVDIDRGADILRPRMAVCGSCHNHGEQLATNKCDPCHHDVRSEGKKPDDHLVHAGNFLREHGQKSAADRAVCTTCHAEQFCTSCHAVTAPAVRERLKFDDPRGAGVHRAGFKARHSDEAKGDPGLCTTCHQPQVCQDCHEKEKLTPKGTLAPKSVHPAGWISYPGGRNDHGRAAWRDPESCAACHGGAGEQLCVGCHKVGGPGGNPHAPGFKSKRQRTVDRTCRMCHVPM